MVGKIHSHGDIWEAKEKTVSSGGEDFLIEPQKGIQGCSLQGPEQEKPALSQKPDAVKQGRGGKNVPRAKAFPQQPADQGRGNGQGRQVPQVAVAAGQQEIAQEAEKAGQKVLSTLTGFPDDLGQIENRPEDIQPQNAQDIGLAGGGGKGLGGCFSEQEEAGGEKEKGHSNSAQVGTKEAVYSLRQRGYGGVAKRWKMDGDN